MKVNAPHVPMPADACEFHPERPARSICNACSLQICQQDIRHHSAVVTNDQSMGSDYCPACYADVMLKAGFGRLLVGIIFSVGGIGGLVTYIQNDIRNAMSLSVVIILAAIGLVLTFLAYRTLTGQWTKKEKFLAQLPQPTRQEYSKRLQSKTNKLNRIPSIIYEPKEEAVPTIYKGRHLYFKCDYCGYAMGLEDEHCLQCGEASIDHLDT